MWLTIRTLMQVQAGQTVAVTHGDTPLKADGTMMGKRLAALIALRDQARRVLQSQNEAWPESHRHDARRELGRLYDRFVSDLRSGEQDHHLGDGKRHHRQAHAQSDQVPRRSRRHAGDVPRALR